MPQSTAASPQLGNNMPLGWGCVWSPNKILEPHLRGVFKAHNHALTVGFGSRVWAAKYLVIFICFYYMRTLISNQWRTMLDSCCLCPDCPLYQNSSPSTYVIFYQQYRQCYQGKLHTESALLTLTAYLQPLLGPKSAVTYSSWVNFTVSFSLSCLGVLQSPVAQHHRPCASPHFA